MVLSTYAGEASDQILMIAIEDDDTMPGVTLTASADSIAEAGGTSNLTTLSVTGRDVTGKSRYGRIFTDWVL